MYPFVKFIKAFGLKAITTRGGTAGNNVDFITGSYLAGKGLLLLMRKTEAVLIQEADLGEVQAKAGLGKLSHQAGHDPFKLGANSTQWLEPRSPAALKGTFCILAFAASNQARMQENKTVSQALFAGAIINIIKQFHKLLPIAGVTFMCRARLSKKGPSCPPSSHW